MIEKLNKIEEKIDLSKISYLDENIWPIFRKTIGWKLFLEKKFNKKNKIKKNKVLIIKDIIINFFKLIIVLRKYDIILFSSSDDYKYINNNYKNRFTDSFFNEYKDLKILEFQSNINKQYLNEVSKNKKTYLSSDILYVLSKIISLFINIKNINSIKNELNKDSYINDNINISNLIKEYKSNKILFNFLYKIIKPKIVISTCHSHMYAVNVANSKKIKTLEFQHGSITSHFAYSINKNINSDFYPNYFLVMGDNDKDYMSKMYYSDKLKIFSIGNMMIDYYSKVKNRKIEKYKKEYSFIICVTMQWTINNKLIEYIKNQANKFSDICFILIPRHIDELNDYKLIHNNMKILESANTYEIISNSDYHLTCYSTCGIEAPSLGTKNIFLNIDNLSKSYYSNYIDKFEFNVIIELNQDLPLDFIKNKNYDKEKIMKENELYIKSNYTDNIKLLSKKLEIL